MPFVGTPVGTTVEQSTSGFEAQITGISFGGMSTEDIDTSHFGTVTAKTFDPADLYDAGSITLTVHFDPSQTLWIQQAKGEWTITWPDDSSTAWTFQGYCNDEAPDATDMDGKMTKDITIKISGGIGGDAST